MPKVNSIKKALCIALIISFVLSLASCGEGDTSPVVMELDGAKVTAAMYHYWASSAKGQYIYSYEDVTNTDDCWAKEFNDGVTVGEYFDSVTLETVKENLVAIKLFDDYGLKITSSEKEGVDGYIGDLIKEYADGSKKLMNTALSEYGINTKLLRELYLDETKSTKVFNYLYGDGGISPITDEEYEKAYSEEYVHFQLIYINDAYKYITDESGNYVTDDSGVYKTEPLEGSEKEKKTATVLEVEKALDSGRDFNEVYNEFSEMKDYPGGYYYSTNEMYGDEVFYKLTAAALKIGNGETAKVETDSGTCFILKLENDEGAWKKEANSDFFENFQDSVKEQSYRAHLREYFDKITVDEEAIKEFSVTKVTPAYSF